MTDRRSLAILRSVTWARIGWNHAGLVIAGPLVFAIIKLAAYAIAFVAVVFGAYWVWRYVPRPVLAGLSWLLGLCLLALAGFARMGPRSRAFLSVASGLFIAAAVLTTTTTKE